ncbi:MAG TPA: hypothetical protein VGM05_06370 [Planctomycetaceae bacterium]|jgi:hypothetical protein
MIELQKSPDQYLLRDAVLEFSLRFVADRWQHAVSVRHDDSWRPVLISDEGCPTDAVLCSPAFQDLRFEQPAEGIFEFQLMGQSGKGVYSAAVRLDAAERMLDFDLCARGPATDPALCTASTYRLAGDGPLPNARVEGGTAIIGTVDGCSIRIIPVPIVGSPPNECRLAGEAHDRRLTVGCFETSVSNQAGASVSAGKTRSIRWRQRMTVSGQP